MNPKDTLKPYIEAHLEKNIPVEVIRDGLVSHGWDASLVDEVIAGTAAGPTPELKEELQMIARSYADEGYNPLSGIKDVVSAFKVNPRVLSFLLLMGAIATSMAELGVARINAVAREVFSSNEDFPSFLFSLFTQMISALLVLTAVWGVAATVLWMTVNDSKEGKKKPLLEAIRSAIPFSARTILATMLYGTVAVSPIIIATLLTQAAITWLSLGLEIGFLLNILGITFAIYLVLKYVFVSIIALFEREVAYTMLFARARHLMHSGGMLFMLQILIPAIIINIAIAYLLPSAATQDGSLSTINIAKSFLFSTISLFISCMWVMYYRNRKIVRA